MQALDSSYRSDQIVLHRACIPALNHFPHLLSLRIHIVSSLLPSNNPPCSEHLYHASSSPSSPASYSARQGRSYTAFAVRCSPRVLYCTLSRVVATPLAVRCSPGVHFTLYCYLSYSVVAMFLLNLNIKYLSIRLGMTTSDGDLLVISTTLQDHTSSNTINSHDGSSQNLWDPTSRRCSGSY